MPSCTISAGPLKKKKRCGGPWSTSKLGRGLDRGHPRHRDIHGRRRLVCAAPTGGGETYTHQKKRVPDAGIVEMSVGWQKKSCLNQRRLRAGARGKVRDARAHLQVGEKEREWENENERSKGPKIAATSTGEKSMSGRLPRTNYTFTSSQAHGGQAGRREESDD